MDNLENYCFRISRSQGMSYLRASGGNYDTVSIFRGFSTSSWTSVVTRIIWMPTDCVLLFYFCINDDRGGC